MKQVCRKQQGFLFRFLGVVALCLCLLGGCGTDAANEEAPLRIGALKGPTTIGLLCMMDQEEYSVTMVTQADELAALLTQKEVDVALLPANLASTLYQKTNHGISVIDLNTLGVLYMVSSESITSIQDLEGKTIYLTGKGTTPDYVLQYILDKNKLHCNLEYKSEATEVVNMISAENQGGIGVLPQPFATVAVAQSPQLKTVFSLNDLWVQLQGENSHGIVTGVTVVGKDYLEKNEKRIEQFLEDHKSSVEECLADLDKAAQLCVAQGIIAKEPVAKKAIPLCNIVSITGEQMQQDLQSYLEILYEYNPAFVGNEMPGEDFYYLMGE